MAAAVSTEPPGPLPKVSILAVTYRPELRPWLWWNIDRQTYPAVEVVIVDQSTNGQSEGDHWELGPWMGTTVQHRTIAAHPKLTVGELRNLAIAFARGDYFVWMDDDDWYHPKRIEWLMDAIGDDPWAGWACGYYLNLALLRGFWLSPRPEIINGATLYRADVARSVAYDAQPRASDARWIKALQKRWGPGKVLDDTRPHAVYGQHRDNLGAGVLRNAPTTLSLPALRDLIGPEAWGDTDEQLPLLVDALGA